MCIMGRAHTPPHSQLFIFNFSLLIFHFSLNQCASSQFWPSPSSAMRGTDIS